MGKVRVLHAQFNKRDEKEMKKKIMRKWYAYNGVVQWPNQNKVSDGGELDRRNWRIKKHFADSPISSIPNPEQPITTTGNHTLAVVVEIDGRNTTIMWVKQLLVAIVG